MGSDQINGGLLASAAVDRFFRRVLADPTLAAGFDGQEIHRLAAQQQAFLLAALTGGQPKAPVTAPAGSEQRVADHLAAALTEVGVPGDKIEAIVSAAQQPAAKPMGYVGKPVPAFTLPDLPERATGVAPRAVAYAPAPSRRTAPSRRAAPSLGPRSLAAPSRRPRAVA